MFAYDFIDHEAYFDKSYLENEKQNVCCIKLKKSKVILTDDYYKIFLNSVMCQTTYLVLKNTMWTKALFYKGVVKKSSAHSPGLIHHSFVYILGTRKRVPSKVARQQVVAMVTTWP